MVRALLVTRAPETAARVELRDDLADGDLGDGDVMVDVQWSSVNYKDALALDGNPGVKRIDPLIPGIDLVGTVSSAPAESRVSAGQAVVLNGWGIGETHHGGYSSRARVNADWLIPLPSGLSAARAAAIGTAGFAAALAVIALEKGGIGDGPILVTGASGGVGSIAIALLATAGYEVVAATGRPAQRDYLLALGASDTLARSELESTGRPLQSQRWAGAIDSVGGTTLANALAQTKWGGTVAACGLVGGSDLPTTVMPFILRGVVLAGINSVECPRDQRLAAWERLARDLDPVLLDSLTTSVGLAEVPDVAAALLRGEGIGRTVVDVTG